MKIWITRYALTDGIFSVEAEVTDNMACFKRGRYMEFAHGLGKQWHETEADAIERAGAMCVAKITSLKKQIAKLEKKTFEPKASA